MTVHRTAPRGESPALTEIPVAAVAVAAVARAAKLKNNPAAINLIAVTSQIIVRLHLISLACEILVRLHLTNLATSGFNTILRQSAMFGCCAVGAFNLEIDAEQGTKELASGWLSPDWL